MLFSNCDGGDSSLVVMRRGIFLVAMCRRLLSGFGKGASYLVVVWGFLSCCSRVFFSNCGGLGSSWESSGVASGGMGLILSCNRELGVPLELLQGC